MFSLFKKKTEDPRGFLQDNQQEPEFLAEVEKEEKRRKVQSSRHESTQQVVDYLISRAGEVIHAKDIAEACGMSEGYVYMILSELQAKKTIKRRGKKGHSTYTVYHRRVNKKRASSTTRKPKVKTTPAPAGVIPEVKSQLGVTELKLLDYIAKHEDVQMTQEDMSRGSGIPPATVSSIVRKLERVKAIVRSLPSYGGTKYWLAESVTAGPNRTALAAKATTPDNQAVLCERIESWVWEYMVATKSTDIIGFVEWLKKRK